MPPKNRVGVDFAQQLDAGLESRAALRWLVQPIGEPPSAKPLGDCSAVELGHVKDCTVNPYTWFTFHDWKNPLIDRFLGSDFSGSFEEFLNSLSGGRP